MRHNDSNSLKCEVRKMAGRAEIEKMPARILLAEDDKEFRCFLASVLRRDGHIVVEARDGTDLVQMVKMLLRDSSQAPLEVLITDIRMPGYSGFDVLEMVRAVDWAILVILITAFGDEETHARALRTGADLILDKPFDVDELRNAILNRAPPSRIGA